MKVFLREVIPEYIASVLRRMDKGDQKVQRKCASLEEMASELGSIESTFETFMHGSRRKRKEHERLLQTSPAYSLLESDESKSHVTVDARTCSCKRRTVDGPVCLRA
jgi:ABC-type lipopolysaccharide export system ATPase subunit